MTASKPFKFLILLGRSGSGKGTQAELLKKKFSFEHISTGNLLRKRTQRHDFVGKKIKAILERGGFVPTPSVFQLWLPVLERLARSKTYQGIIFDGSPRKFCEAVMLDELIAFYGWESSKVVSIDISEKEAMARLLKRGRYDDERRKIQSRLSLFRTEVMPVLKYYQKKGALFRVDGEQPIEDVHEEILKKLNHFFGAL